MRTYSIGVDIGTKSTKAVLFSETNEVIEQVSKTYPLHAFEPHAAEQQPENILEAVLQALEELLEKAKKDKRTVDLISFSAAMHSLLVVDEQNQLLTPSYTWADQRSEPYARQLKENNGQDIYEKTGTPIHPMSPLVKIIWLREEKTAIFKQAAKFLGVKEYIFYHLFGCYVTDWSMASATGLMNMETLNWDPLALKAAGISREQLPEIVPTTKTFQKVQPHIAKRLGLETNIPFVIGANDGALANLGVHAIEPGVIALTIGTSGAIRTVTKEPVTDGKGRFFCYALTEKHWVVGGPVNNGGLAFDWMLKEFAREEMKEAKKIGADPFSYVFNHIQDIPAGSDGLLFYPYLTGERAPLWNAHAKGSFYGISLHHQKEHFMHAVLEGILLNLWMVYETLEPIIGSPDKIQVSGGFAQSSSWRQMLANIFNTKIYRADTVENSALGAVILGRYALGKISSLEEGAQAIQTRVSNTPEAKQVAVYKELAPLYKEIGAYLEKGYDAISSFQQRHVNK